MIDLEYKEILIKPEWTAYPYGPAYHLSLIIDGKVYYKFSDVVTDDLIKKFLHHLGCLLEDDILTEVDGVENNEKIS